MDVSLVIVYREFFPKKRSEKCLAVFLCSHHQYGLLFVASWTRVSLWTVPHWFAPTRFRNRDFLYSQANLYVSKYGLRNVFYEYVPWNSKTISLYWLFQIRWASGYLTYVSEEIRKICLLLQKMLRANLATKFRYTLIYWTSGFVRNNKIL